MLLEINGKRVVIVKVLISQADSELRERENAGAA
jgi:hypothetical protein